MKKIEAIFRPTKVAEVCAALEEAGHLGLMLSEIEGRGVQKGLVHNIRGKDYRVDLLPKVRLEIVVADAEVEKVLDAIRKAAFTGEIGDGKLFILPVDDALRVRTNERGDVAL
jgi:nitrogen regulatory protein P-II 1